MPISETTIITGKNRNIGLRVAVSVEVMYSTVIPAIAAIIATGISRASGFVRFGSGGSGGASMTNRPVSIQE
ncbi:hypothetical protein MPRF_01700 [Mycolicibacterium parafortuitum]|uniref:Uncharacterized protein n=1 Tax=Mycolicibacterium parafortuitum TaxID=39692 RepID=A0A7I7TX92_MYCPF|nr:hypothetical protein MPRF_01700 [Mycolicibacterium parafortuitum]